MTCTQSMVNRANELCLWCMCEWWSTWQMHDAIHSHIVCGGAHCRRCRFVEFFIGFLSSHRIFWFIFGWVSVLCQCKCTRAPTYDRYERLFFSFILFKNILNVDGTRKKSELKWAKNGKMTIFSIVVVFHRESDVINWTDRISEQPAASMGNENICSTIWFNCIFFRVDFSF